MICISPVVVLWRSCLVLLFSMAVLVCPYPVLGVFRPSFGVLRQS